MKFCILLFAALFSINSSLHAQINLTAHVAGRSHDLSHAQLPAHARAHALRTALAWDTLQRGLELAEFTVEAGRLGADVRIIALRIQPRHFDFELVHQTRTNRMTGAWTVDAANDDVAFAFNAGQFKETGPWGWLVMHHEERRDPGYGPLSAGIAFDTSGAIRWIPFDALEKARADRSVRFAFQSYPTLLFGGLVPKLPASADLLDRDHRDTRLILADDAEGRMLVVLTRYDGLGTLTGRVPIGLTVPESIVLIAAMGARHAVMLDGGVSAQLLVRDHAGSVRAWKGLRAVPLALVAKPRVH
jgi:hypothetical protein